MTLAGTNPSGATGGRFTGTAATTFRGRTATTATATVSPGTTTGNVKITTPGGTSNGRVFAPTHPDLAARTTTTIPAGPDNPIAVTGTGTGPLAGNATVNPAAVVQTGGTLTDGCFVRSGAGSFPLAAGATLGICVPAGITASGATGAVQPTGTRSFSTGANYMYNGTAVQATGTGLPDQVRNPGTTNAAAVTRSAPTSVTQVLTVGTAGNLVLNGQSRTLRPSAAGTALALVKSVVQKVNE